MENDTQVILLSATVPSHVIGSQVVVHSGTPFELYSKGTVLTRVIKVIKSFSGNRTRNQ